MDKETFDSIKDFTRFNLDVAMEQRQCVNCGQHYTEKDNMGKWQCWQHAGKIINGVWSCCHLRTARSNKGAFYRAIPQIGQSGCVRADHTQAYTRYTKQNCAVIEKERLSIFQTFRNNAIELFYDPEDETENIIAWRYDKQGEEQMQLINQYHAMAMNGYVSPMHVVKTHICQKEHLIQRYLHHIETANEAMNTTV